MAGSPETSSAPSPGLARLSFQWGVAALLAALLAAALFDRWYTVHLEAESRVAVQRAMGPTAAALRAAVARRVAQLNGLHSF
ncbi:MAG TPA: hypothetical protein PLY94_10950, partial [Gemmatimonadaceae bacterium]|nr:hypothetical protein [Gemmatimonadaceae bacterium]